MRNTIHNNFTIIITITNYIKLRTVQNSYAFKIMMIYNRGDKEESDSKYTVSVNISLQTVLLNRFQGLSRSRLIIHV